MPVIRRLINTVEQWLDDLDYTPRGRDHLEVEFKLAYHLSLVRCSTVVHAFSFFMLMLESQIFFKIYATDGELSYMDLYHGFFMHLYWMLLGGSAYSLIASQRNNSFSFFNVMVLVSKFNILCC